MHCASDISMFIALYRITKKKGFLPCEKLTVHNTNKKWGRAGGKYGVKLTWPNSATSFFPCSVRI